MFAESLCVVSFRLVMNLESRMSKAHGRLAEV